MADPVFMAAFARRLNSKSATLAKRLREEVEAAGRRYAEGQCSDDEYRACLDRFTRLVLYGEPPREDEREQD